MNTATKTIGSIAALGALALGGSALADAASSTSTSGNSSSSTTTQPSGAQPSAGRPPALGPHGRHVGANGQEEQALSADVAKKVAAAALAKVGSGTVERTETDVDHGSPYEAHVRKSDGTELEILVNDNFEVTAVNTMGGHP